MASCVASTKEDFGRGYQEGIRRIRPLLGQRTLDILLMLEADELAMRIVYGPALSCPKQLGYAAVMGLLHYETDTGYQWLGSPQDLVEP